MSISTRREPLQILAACLAITGAAAADDASVCPVLDVDTCTIGDRVIYQPSFFTRYNPVNAFDMVARVPGFTLDTGDSVRGFGGSAGNVLINGERPSTKSMSIEETLSRISASAVARIELIRGGTGDLDVGGQTVVVNVILNATAAGGSSLWQAALLKRRPNGKLRPAGEISISGERGATKYTLGADAYGIGLRFTADEDIFRASGANETRRREGSLREQGGGVNARIEHRVDDNDTFRLNGSAEIERSRQVTEETRFPATGGPDIAIFTFPNREFEFEFGGDYEHEFSAGAGLKLIALFRQETEKFESGFEFLPAAGADDRSLFISDQTAGETIGRVEFSWRNWPGHSIQLGGEIARNFIESAAELLVDDGAGGLVPVVIDGANTRVAELRGEPFINDSWKARDKLTIDSGLAVELSRIAQTGDGANSRFFTYLKPSLALAYAVNPKLQIRLSARRTVNQLSFDDFVSAVDFDDEDVDFGNPDLRPQRAWSFEGAVEKRYGEIGVVELKGFYEAVQDVEDLLPIGGIVEVPGNIGDGEIYGVSLKMTTPLDTLMLTNARLESDVTVRDSNVTDPVTGLTRDFSETPDIFFELGFRQDFPAWRTSWGWGARRATRERGFGLDEVSVFRNQLELNAFIESTAVRGVKARFEFNDIINVTSLRDRTVYDGSRADNDALFREIRRSNNGGGLRLILSGSF